MDLPLLYNGVAKFEKSAVREVCKMDVPLNVNVYCVDGLCGQSKEVVLDRKTEEVSHLVVKEKDAPRAELLVPVELVTETTPRLIRLRCAKEELAEMQPLLRVEVVREEIPHYLPDPYLMPMEVPETKWVTVSRESIPPGEVAVRQGARVEATDGLVGRLDEFLVDPVTEQVTHLVMREGHLWGQRDVTIPVSEIDRLEENTIYLRLDKAKVGALPSVRIGIR
jgi:sporulation protein YlmC with PRC-barrel domain